ncbi:MAG: LTA synthase family protein [Hyphomicrobiales bacterium]|nr:LTA synthase family protein [Hyphomicrobiales bacterium]MCP5372516.1 LTA synthase family protein [Hyphomicrobiales bacterium]
MTRGARRLAWIAACFLLVSLGTRVGLALFAHGAFTVPQWSKFLTVGLVFDLAVLPWFLLPWAVYEAVRPGFAGNPRLARWEDLWASLWAALYLSLFAVVAAAEFAFWGEFGSRFDFIAVDYLVYTHEVVGNIMESYPVALWAGALAAVAVVATRVTWPRAAAAGRAGPARRWGRVAVLAAWAGLAALGLDPGFAEDANTQVAQLSGNGVFAFVHAYRHNQLDYGKYYPTLPVAEMNDRIRALVRQDGTEFTAARGIERRIRAHGPARPVNVVLISVESLSAEYLGHFGNTRHLTPELDRLADRGLLFTSLYATGTRTVRGLEALSVGTPPTPGQSIVRRPRNAGLENLGEELEENGWTPYWIYGGYGFFDNMNVYFGANHYTVADREAMDAEGLPIHAENIWGIADEDLFSLALSKFDREHAAGHRFFAHVMTTSNHRPYTFPEGRVDWPQKHREGAVAYTDWALGDFIRRAAAKPWFDDTLFIILADHTAKAAGKTDLPPARYHIPMIWYAPKLVKPAAMDRLMSQIDVAPTLLGWLGLDYTSRFFGYDLFTLEPGRERAFISTYQKLGYLKAGRLVVLDVNKGPAVTAGLDAAAGPDRDADLAQEAIAWYQSASRYFTAGLLKDVDDD